MQKQEDPNFSINRNEFDRKRERTKKFLVGQEYLFGAISLLGKGSVDKHNEDSKVFG